MNYKIGDTCFVNGIKRRFIAGEIYEAKNQEEAMILDRTSIARRLSDEIKKAPGDSSSEEKENEESNEKSTEQNVSKAQELKTRLMKMPYKALQSMGAELGIKVVGVKKPALIYNIMKGVLVDGTDKEESVVSQP